MRAEAPARHDLVLVGGGHSHALALRMLAMDPIPGTRLTLVSPDALTPYSGMLPGLIAGHYDVAQTHIDLSRLCQWAGARFVRGTVTGLDPERNQLTLADGQTLEFDWLSIDTGSTPQMDDVPGAREFALAVKPVATLRKRWADWIDGLDHKVSPRLVVVGGGAGGVEMAAASAYALRRQGLHARITLASSHGLLPGYPRRLRAQMSRYLSEAGIEQVQGRVESVSRNQVHLAGQTLEQDAVIWCTGATGHDFLAASSLATTDQGFVRVRETLQSESHAHVFAAGDCAHFVPAPLPKAGVFAVRQARTLAHNLRAAITGAALRPYRPQRHFLSLLSAGTREACGSRSGLTFSGAWVWAWKDRIDRKFMARFEDYPERRMPEPVDPEPRCAGCGAKVGSTALDKALVHLAPVRHDDVIAGLAEREDASIVRWPTRRDLVQSHDYFPAFINEPGLFGRLAVIHALSDIYAMNAQPHSALATVTLPVNHQVLQGRDLKRLMAGAVQELNRADCALLGGHTIEGPQMAAGFTINALGHPDRLFRKAGARPGDRLVLTRPLGTGILLAAHMQNRCRGDWLDEALLQMLQHNQRAATIFSESHVRACTDVTGFGLLGHLQELCDASQVGAQLDSRTIATLDGVLTLASEGIESTLKPGNDAVLASCDIAPALHAHPLLTVMTDPQTCGGLLAAVPGDRLDTCLAKMRESFIPAMEVGMILERQYQTNIIVR